MRKHVFAGGNTQQLGLGSKDLKTPYPKNLNPRITGLAYQIKLCNKVNT